MTRSGRWISYSLLGLAILWLAATFQLSRQLYGTIAMPDPLIVATGLVWLFAPPLAFVLALIYRRDAAAILSGIAMGLVSLLTLSFFASLD
ncbi:hypothetical protein EDD27_6015 [Nonomuraea polychroma]|uniref:Uncharacterized protein n=1 Tax=Nonomuraea polychroma TaxID=46176 RepID=A0A438MC81_9ACTN|nr:hypothetical protein [Nonomuraea polychroma]RVX43334.1 hypothetical protein EDD27_6015 [Nonomuraea polychroma]